MAEADERRLTRRRLLIEGAAGLSTLALGWPARAAGRPVDTDVCIVGSGFAGIPLALRCVEQGLRVAVVEAGSRFAPSFRYRTSGGFDYPLAASRLIMLGGTSGHWGGVTTRLMPEDFKVRSLYGDWVDWPIGYAELDPYYCEAERLLHVVGSPADPKAQPPQTCPYRHDPRDRHPGYALELGEQRLAFFRPPYARRKGKPLRLADAEIPRFQASPRAQLLDGRRVVDFVTLDGESIDHVRMQDPSGAQSALRARSFVVAAGVVESPRLLLMSRSKWFPDGLGNRQGLVGRYFTYHPQFFTGRFQATGAAGVPPRNNRTYGLNPVLRGQHLNACNFQIVRSDGPAGATPQLSMGISPELEPRPENRVALAGDSVDPLGLPIPDLQVSHSARDKRSFARVKAIGDQLQRQLGARRSQGYGSRIHSHPAGTCRMGSDAKTGVVDKDLKVFGLANLYVSGAAVFPVSGTSNPTDTVVALTLRLGDHLIARLGG